MAIYGQCMNIHEHIWPCSMTIYVHPWFIYRHTWTYMAMYMAHICADIIMYSLFEGVCPNYHHTGPQHVLGGVEFDRFGSKPLQNRPEPEITRRVPGKMTLSIERVVKI